MSRTEDPRLRDLLEGRLRQVCPDPSVRVGSFDAGSDSFLIVRSTPDGWSEPRAKIPTLVIEYERWEEIDTVLKDACHDEQRASPGDAESERS